MRIAVSNLAWRVDEDEAVVAVLQNLGVDAIDLCPSKYFPNPASAKAEDIAAVSAWWNQRGIRIFGLQSLLFGLQGVNVFGTPLEREKILAHLAGVCDVARRLGAERLVFGSPKQRNRVGVADDDVKAIATAFFRRCGDIAGAHGVVLCLEPNPPEYGSTFMNDSNETAAVVRYVDHPAVLMQCDTGAMTLNEEDPAVTLPPLASLVAHVHVSEPYLAPVGTGHTCHERMAHVLRSIVPNAVATIEMLPAQVTGVDAIRQAIEFAKRCYSTDYPVTSKV